MKSQSLTEKTFEIEVKRFHLPLVITRKCTNCGHIMEKDLNSDYLSYPTANKTEEIGFWCEECDSEFVLYGKLVVDLELADEVIN